MQLPEPATAAGTRASPNRTPSSSKLAPEPQRSWAVPEHFAAKVPGNAATFAFRWRTVEQLAATLAEIARAEQLFAATMEFDWQWIVLFWRTAACPQGQLESSHAEARRIESEKIPGLVNLRAFLITCPSVDSPSCTQETLILCEVQRCFDYEHEHRFAEHEGRNQDSTSCSCS